MSIETDDILKRLISSLPEHAPKTDLWPNISDKLDDEISMSKLREILKQKEHTPKQTLWSNIENKLNLRYSKTSLFISFSILCSLFITCGVLWYLLNKHTNTAQSAIAVSDENQKFLSPVFRFVYRDIMKSAAPSDSSKNNADHDLGVINDTQAFINNLPVHVIPSQTLQDWLKQKDSLERVMRENDTINRGINEKKNVCSISGKVEWEMIKAGFVSLFVFAEEGKLISTIFEKKKFETGQQSYDFKLVDCNLRKDKKYILKLKINGAIIKEMELTAK
jgi:hypothetical protein